VFPAGSSRNAKNRGGSGEAYQPIYLASADISRPVFRRQCQTAPEVLHHVSTIYSSSIAS
jgi:hypothetical protein